MLFSDPHKPTALYRRKNNNNVWHLKFYIKFEYCKVTIYEKGFKTIYKNQCIWKLQIYKKIISTKKDSVALSAHNSPSPTAYTPWPHLPECTLYQTPERNTYTHTHTHTHTHIYTHTHWIWYWQQYSYTNLDGRGVLSLVVEVTVKLSGLIFNWCVQTANPPRNCPFRCPLQHVHPHL